MASFAAPKEVASANAVASLAFSENGFWFAASWEKSARVVVFDLRKEGNAAVAKVLEFGDDDGAAARPGPGLAWDYSGQYLLGTVGDGIVVLAYNKSAKSWGEVLKTQLSGERGPAVNVRWGEGAKSLVVLRKGGELIRFGVGKPE